MTRFRWIAGLLLVWSLMGVAAFIMQISTPPEAMGDPVTARAFGAMPGWVWGAYAVAVASGLLGSILLLRRHRLAWVLFALSLVAVVIQFGWTILGFRLLDYKGPEAMIFPAVIALIALFGTLFAHRHTGRLPQSS